MRVRGVPPVREGVREVREGGVRLPQDCAAREGAVRRARVRCGRVWMRARGVPVREGVREVRVRLP